MSNDAPAALPTQRFTLNAVPPVRPLAIAAVAGVLGAVLVVVGRAAELPSVLAILGGVMLALAVVLVGAALMLTLRVRTEVRLEPDVLTVVRGGRERSVPWREVQEVQLEHPRLSVVTADPDRGLLVVNPRRADDPHFARLTEQVRQRLDADRGYQTEPGASPDTARP